MFRTDVWALPPGITAAVETYEAAFRWGPAGQGLITSAVINASATDPGNGATTFELRPGLLMGQRTDGTWINYSPTNTDGSQVAAGVIITGIRMTDILTQVGQARYYGMLVGGPVQAAKIIGLDLMARACLSDHFWFDDAGNMPGNHWFPYRAFVTKTAAYSATALDNFTQFNNLGATGSVTITLPPIANGYYFSFAVEAAQTFAATSFEGGNLIGSTLTQNTVSSNAIGGLFDVYTNAAGTKWIVEQRGTQTLSFS